MLKNLKLNFIEVTILASYFLFTIFLALGLIGLFHRTLVILSVVLLVLLLWFFRKSIVFEKRYFWFFLLVPAAVLGFAFLRGFFVGDVYEFWLPIARETVITGSIPEFMRGLYYSRMPLVGLLLAGTFSVMGSFNQFLPLWMPLFFSSATLIILYQWGEEKGLSKKYLYFIVILFLASPLIAPNAWNPFQEATLLFFATTFFYNFEKYLTLQNKRNLVFVLLSFVMVVASKISGLFLLLLMIYLFIRAKDKKQVIGFSLVLGLPVLAWLLRNYLVFGDPVFPLLGSIFPGQVYATYLKYQSFRTLDLSFQSVWSRFSFILPQLLLFFPFLVLSFYEFIKSRKYEFLAIFSFYFIYKEAFLFTPSISFARYYYLFIGLLILYGVAGLKRVNSKIFLFGLLLLAIAGLPAVPIVDSQSVFISGFEQTFSAFGKILELLRDYWYLLMLILAPIVYLLAKKSFAKSFLVFFYILYILNIGFVANKSWLVVWPFIILSLLLLVFFALQKKEVNMQPLMTIFVTIVIFTTSWGLGAVYSFRHNFTFPVAYLHEDSREAQNVIDSDTAQEPDDYFVLVAAQPGYFNWFTDYRAVKFIDFGFFYMVRDYHNGISSHDLKIVLEENRFQYLVKNVDRYDFSQVASDNLNNFFSKIENSDEFELISDEGDDISVWKVY